MRGRILAIQIILNITVLLEMKKGLIDDRARGMLGYLDNVLFPRCGIANRSTISM